MNKENVAVEVAALGEKVLLTIDTHGAKLGIGFEAISQAVRLVTESEFPVDVSPYESVQSAIGRLSRIRFDTGNPSEGLQNVEFLAQAILSIVAVANENDLHLSSEVLRLLKKAGDAMANSGGIVAG